MSGGVHIPPTFTPLVLSLSETIERRNVKFCNIVLGSERIYIFVCFDGATSPDNASSRCYHNKLQIAKMLRIQRNTVIQTRSRQLLIASRTNFERLKMDTLIVYVSVYVVKNTFISSILNA